MPTCYFVSDLHLLADRSDAYHYLEEIVEAAVSAEMFVLGGDTFDFPWSPLPIRRSVDYAARWLHDLTSMCPECHFHLVLGNHDYHQLFIDRLIRLERQVHNLSWHRYYFRLGSNVCLHGDVVSRRMDAQRLARARDRWLDKRRRGPFLSSLYDVVVQTRLHKPVAHLVYSKRIVVRRILKYLESIGQGPANGVRDVYFGHTHRGMSDYSYRGLLFHNGGAPIKGMKFRIVEVRM